MTVIDDPLPTASAITPLRAPSDRDRRQVTALALQLAVIAVAIGVWWIGCEVLAVHNPILSHMGPHQAFAALWTMVTNGSAATDVITSLRRLGLGLVIATLCGVPLGLLTGSRPAVDRASSPLVQFIRMLSPLAWAPAAVAMFGIGDSPVTFLVAIATVFPIMLGTAAGVRALEPGWSKVAKSLGATPVERLRTVILPGIRPHVLTALRLALGVGWVVLVPAEMLGVTSGLGYAVLNARDQLSYDQLAATMLLIGIVGYLIDLAFRRVLSPDLRH